MEGNLARRLRNATSGQTMSEIQQQIHTSYLSTLRTSIVIWPLASLINFYFISVEYRLFFTGCKLPRLIHVNLHQGVSIGWNAYLSSVKHNSTAKGAPILPVTMKAVAPAVSSLNKTLLFPAKVSVI